MLARRRVVGYLGAFGLCEVETVEKVIAVSAAGRALGEDAPRARWPERDVERVRALCAAGALAFRRGVCYTYTGIFPCWEALFV